MTKKTAIENVIDYVLESECEDFAENPSDYHVYFAAMVVAYGLSRAKHYLKEAEEDLEESDEEV